MRITIIFSSLAAFASAAYLSPLIPRQAVINETVPNEIAATHQTLVPDHSALTLGTPTEEIWEARCNFAYFCNQFMGSVHSGQQFQYDVWNWWVGAHGQCAVALYAPGGVVPDPFQCGTNFDGCITVAEVDTTKTTFRVGWNVQQGHFPADLNATVALPNTYSTSNSAWVAEDSGQPSYIILGIA